MINCLDRAYIEVTRRCNMKCAHCLRGPAQNIDLSFEEVDAFLDNFSFINQITLGGGEPTLNPDMIAHIIDKIIENNIVVETLGMITNGQIYDQKIADALNRFDAYSKRMFYSKEPEYTSNFVSHRVKLGFSTDKYHKGIKPEVEKAYKENCKWIHIYDHLIDDTIILHTGYSTFGIDYRYRLPNSKYVIEDDRLLVVGSLNINARGLITSNAAADYLDEDMKNYGHVYDFVLFDYLKEHGIPIKNSPRVEELDEARKLSLKRKSTNRK